MRSVISAGWHRACRHPLLAGRPRRGLLRAAAGIAPRVDAVRLVGCGS